GFIAFTGFASLTKWNSLRPYFTFVGLANYARLFSTVRFQIDLHNTVTFTVLFLLFCLTLGFGLAVLLDRGVRGEGIFRSIFLFPLALSFIVTGVVWRWLLNPGSVELGSTGVNLLLERVGLGFLKSGWYTDPAIGIKAVVVAATWPLSGYVMAMYLAGGWHLRDPLDHGGRADRALPGLQPAHGDAAIAVRAAVPMTRRQVPWLRPVAYAILVAAALFYLLPIYVLVITGMKSFAEVNLYRMWDLPSRFSLDSFVKAWLGSEAQGFRGLNHNFW